MKVLLKALGFTLPAVLLVLSGCGSSQPAPATTSTQAASTDAVTISNFAFSQASLTVAVGATVTWTNKDSATHTVVSDSGLFNSGNIAQNKTFSYTFGTAGTFAYHCSIHLSMTGTIIVR